MLRDAFDISGGKGAQVVAKVRYIVNRATSLTTSTKKKRLLTLLATVLVCVGMVAGLYASNTAASDDGMLPHARIGNDPAVRATLDANPVQETIQEPTIVEP
jgi:hypothetical protein